MMTDTERAAKCLLSLQQALYHATRDNRGSVGAIADIYGINASTLHLKVNPNRETHHCNPEDIERILSYTRDPRIMDAICAAHGRAVWYELPDIGNRSGTELFAGFGDVSERVGMLGKRLFEAVQDGCIDADELDALTRASMELQSATAALIEMARRKAEESGHGA